MLPATSLGRDNGLPAKAGTPEGDRLEVLATLIEVGSSQFIPANSEHKVLGATASISRRITLQSAPARSARAASPVASMKVLARMKR
jgi:hypothetical protein